MVMVMEETNIKRMEAQKEMILLMMDNFHEWSSFGQYE
jgi:hypothetical protein